MEPSTDDEGDAGRYSHPFHLPAVVEVKLGAEGPRARKRDSFRRGHGLVRRATGARQHGIVGHKRHQTSGGERSSQVLLILVGLQMPANILRIVAVVVQRFPGHLGQMGAQDVPGPASAYVAASRRKPHRQASLDEVSREKDGRSFQDVLSRLFHAHLAAFGPVVGATTAGLFVETPPLDGGNKCPVEQVAKCDLPQSV